MEEERYINGNRRTTARVEDLGGSWRCTGRRIRSRQLYYGVYHIRITRHRNALISQTERRGVNEGCSDD